MNVCPCCSEPMLRHIHRQGVYWFCPHCRQEMPDLNAAIAIKRALASSLSHPNHPLTLLAPV